MHALCSGDPGILLLKGHDPSGWFGWNMAAGAWIVRPALTTTSGPKAHAPAPTPSGRLDETHTASSAQQPNDTAEQREWDHGIDIAARLGGHLAQMPLGIPSAQRLPLGDVATQGLTRGARPDEATTTRLFPWLDNIRPEVQIPILTAHTLGRSWVREQVNRLTALYRGFPNLPSDDTADSLPTHSEAARALRELAKAARTIQDAEESRGRTGSIDTNEMLRHWVDIADSFSAAADALRRR